MARNLTWTQFVQAGASLLYHSLSNGTIDFRYRCWHKIIYEANKLLLFTIRISAILLATAMHAIIQRADADW